jgi:hypothetical protein
MTTRETTFQEILYPQEDGIPDKDWSRAFPKASLVPVLPNFGSEMLTNVNKDIKATVPSLLQMNPISLLLAGWFKWQEVARVLEESRQKPAEPIIKQLFKHTVKSSHQPSIKLVLGEMPVCEIAFKVTAFLEVEGLHLKIQDGQILEIMAGTCQGKITLACMGQLLKEMHTSRFPLSGPLPLRPALVVSQPVALPVLLPVAHATLTGISRETAGQVFHLSDGAVIGRSHESTLQLSDPNVSRRHARLRQGIDCWYLQDMNSKLGTYVNGARVDAQALKNGDHIRIDTFEFEFHA